MKKNWILSLVSVWLLTHILAVNSTIADQLTRNEQFLKEWAEVPGTIKRRSGLLIRIIERGTGPIPSKEGMVEVHYEGRLIDGTIFDSSYDRGEPVRFQIPNVIDGWQEALTLMRVGGKWEVAIPANLAYGVQGGPGNVPSDSILLFKMELLAVY